MNSNELIEKWSNSPEIQMANKVIIIHDYLISGVSSIYPIHPSMYLQVYIYLITTQNTYTFKSY